MGVNTNTTKKEPKQFKEMSVKEIAKKYFGDAYYTNSRHYYASEDVMSGIGNLSAMIKEKDAEIACLKDMLEFMQRIVDQVFDNVKKDK